MGTLDRPGVPGTRLQTADVERLYREAGPKLHQFIRRQVPEPAVAADLLQDVFVRLIRAGAERRSDGEMRSYLYRTATSLIAEHYRVRKLRRTVPFVPEDDQREPQMQVHDEADAVDRGKLDSRTGHGFAQLGIKDRTLLWLAYVEEMSHADIGATVGVRTASVKVMLSRARTRLAAALKAMGTSPVEKS